MFFLKNEFILYFKKILCELEVNIPMSLLLRTFQAGLNSLQKLESRAMRRREASNSFSQNSTSNDIELEQAHFSQILNNNAFTVFDTYDAYKVYINQLMLQRMTGHELAQLIKEEEEDFIINNSELNITCCIMMLDMVLKQLDNQKHAQCLGMYNPLSKELLLLISKHLVLPWIKKHKCKQSFGILSSESIPVLSNASSPNYCPFCEEYVLWFTFAKDILVYISPKQEIEIPEMNFHHLLDTVATRESFKMTRYSEQSIEAAEKPLEQGANENDTVPSQPEAVKKLPPKKTDPDAGIWVTSYGIYYFKLNQLQPHLQLFHSMLRELYRVPDVDAFYNLLVSLKLLIMHGDCLDTANKEQKGFLIYCLEKLLVPR